MTPRPELTPTCIWRAAPELVLALQERLGDPLDTYVNGSQVWLREDGPDEMTIEWRLHPVAGYKRPAGQTTESVFASAAMAIANGDAPPVPVEHLWGGLEAFPAFGDEIEPAVLRSLTVAVLGREPDAYGLVDHRSAGDAWEQDRTTVDLVQVLLAQLAPEA